MRSAIALRALRLSFLAALGSGLPACAAPPSGGALAPSVPALRGPARAVSAASLVDEALEAMGGRARLAQIRTVRADVVKHTSSDGAVVLRQSPFLTSYERDRISLDLVGKRLRVEAHGIWPESDPGTAESDVTLVGSLAGAVYHLKEGDSPARLADLDAVRLELELGPLTMLRAAAAAADLHAEPEETIRATVDDVVGFTWRGVAAKIALNPFTHLHGSTRSRRRRR